MNIIEKIIQFINKAKDKGEKFKTKIENFIELNKGNIKVLMNVLQVIYDKGKGREKMENVVKTVCAAAGIAEFGEEYADDIADFVEAKCQAIYDELIADGGLKK